MKKVVNVPEDIDAERLQELAASSFGMQPEVTGVKYFDKEFEEWLLIPDDFVPTNKERLQMIPIDIVRNINFVVVAKPVKVFIFRFCSLETCLKIWHLQTL